MKKINLKLWFSHREPVADLNNMQQALLNKVTTRLREVPNSIRRGMVVNKPNLKLWFSQGEPVADSNNMQQALLNKVTTRLHEVPTLKIGPRRFHYLYSAVLPQVHLTLVSILQGIAFGVLLLNIPLPNNTSVHFSLEFFLQQFFYLPYLTGSLGILIIWKQFVYASLCRNWPASTTQVILIYMLAVAEVIVFRVLADDSNPSKPLLSETVPIWLLSVASITIFGGSIRLNDVRIEKKVLFEDEQVGKSSRKGDLYNGVSYVAIGIVLIILFIFYSRIVNFVQLTFHDTSFIPWFVYIALFVMTCCVLQLDTIHRHDFIKKLLEGSDLIASDHGVIIYEMENDKNQVVEDTLIARPITNSMQAQSNEVVERQVHHLISAKFYRYSCFSLLSVIIGGVLALLLSRNGRKRQ